MYTVIRVSPLKPFAKCLGWLYFQSIIWFPEQNDSMSRKRSRSPVRESAHNVMENAEYVSINDTAITNLADELIEEYSFTHARWDAPVFLSVDEHGIEDVVDFMITGNAVNYCFNYLNTGEKYTTEYNGVRWEGAFGMWAALRKAYENNDIVFTGEELSCVSTKTIDRIFESVSGRSIPKLQSRVRNIQSVGTMLEKKNSGSFAEDFTDDTVIYGENGVVEEIANEPPFEDAAKYNGEDIRFDKRAQLAVSMLYGKLLGTRYEFNILDKDSFTVFADYGIPAGLATKGVLEYDSELKRKITDGKLIQQGSKMEVEIRAGTVVVGDYLKEILEGEHGCDVDIPVLDHVLWQMRSEADTNVHLTDTTAY